MLQRRNTPPLSMTDIWTQKDRYAGPVRGKKTGQKCPVLFLKSGLFRAREATRSSAQITGGYAPSPPKTKRQERQKRKWLKESRRAHISIASQCPCAPLRRAVPIRIPPALRAAPDGGKNRGERYPPGASVVRPPCGAMRRGQGRKRRHAGATLDRMSKRSTVASRRGQGGYPLGGAEYAFFWPLRGPQSVEKEER
nr:unnamed protein product [uncultured bacterium]